MRDASCRVAPPISEHGVTGTRIGADRCGSCGVPSPACCPDLRLLLGTAARPVDGCFNTDICSNRQGAAQMVYSRVKLRLLRILCEWSEPNLGVRPSGPRSSLPLQGVNACLFVRYYEPE